MRKSSASDGDGDKTVRFEISRGGYVTEDEEVALPIYLVHPPSQNDVIMDIDAEEELNERGNYGYSDDNSENIREFGDTMKEFELERLCVLLVDDGI